MKHFKKVIKINTGRKAHSPHIEYIPQANVHTAIPIAKVKEKPRDLFFYMVDWRNEL